MSPSKLHPSEDTPAAPLSCDPSLDGLHILGELPDPQSVVLWNAFRDVVLWSGTPPRNRSGLFRTTASDARLSYLAEAGFPPEADSALSTLAALLATPAHADAELVSSSCRRLARWLSTTGAPRSASSLAHAAALALPCDPAPALEAGALARAAGETHRAEEWFRRALSRAQRARAPWALVAANVRLGEVLEQRGATVPAGRRYRAAAHHAARHHLLSPARGEAHAALFRLARAAGQHRAAGYHAGQALRHLPHAARHALLHDYACLWSEQGKHAHAVALLRKLAPVRARLEDRADSWVAMAEAAAAAGLRRGYDRAWEEAQHLLGEMGEAAPEGLARRLGDAAARMLDATINGQRRQA